MLRETLAELLFPWPVICAVCGKKTEERSMLCAGCRKRLEGQKVHRGFANDRNVEDSVAAHRYVGAGGKLVRTLKYRGVAALADSMADDMVTAAETAGMERPDAVTYVPMHVLRRRARPFNQSELLGQRIAAALGLRQEKLLRRTRRCKQQARLRDERSRRRNVEDAFRATQNLEGFHVLLIDDVCTTGATAQECAKALREAGAAKVTLLVYADAHRDAPKLRKIRETARRAEP